MPRAILKVLAGGLLALALAPGNLSRQSLAAAQAQPPKPAEPLKLKVGDTAPDFKLLAFDGQKTRAVSLSDYKGKKNVALAFYVFAFTGG